MSREIVSFSLNFYTSGANGREIKRLEERKYENIDLQDTDLDRLFNIRLQCIHFEVKTTIPVQDFGCASNGTFSVRTLRISNPEFQV